jgi:tRNA G10  N-methylase Trm11
MNQSETKSIFILGRQPALGIAELECLYGPDCLLPFGKSVCLSSLDIKDIDFDRLGGSVRVAKYLFDLPSTNWKDIHRYLIEALPERAMMVDGKLSFGISVFGLETNPRNIAKTALLLKKAIRQIGKSVRMVPHDKSELGSATVLYNKLTGPSGWELLVISDGKTAFLAQTIRIQDIDAYSARDQARPYRDAKVGMLPPKLAQIIINLGVGNTKYEIRNTKQNLNSKLENNKHRTLILDPFCGTGVVLQEAMLMDYDIYGTDLEPRMVQYSIDNLAWLDEKHPDAGDYRRIEVGDATTHNWDMTKVKSRKSTLVVAGETFLGQPLSSLPNGEHLSKIIYEVNLMHHKFLENIGKQIPSGTRLCMAVPTWRGKHEFLHLPTLDHLTDIGYTRMRFKHVNDEDLIYHRENQVVGRELLVLEKR